ncbi:MAG: efflux RND transporter periplasmic adaptor subunit [Pseudomonadota bacterium]|nr:efflux RND transporter periplasmic adaptor subunit [Pseudomonadota bacterium]
MDKDNGAHSSKDVAKGLLQLILIIAFIVGSFMASNALKTNKALPQVKKAESKRTIVDVMNVSPAPYHVEFSVPGLVEAPSELQLTPEVSGRVVKVNASARSGANFKAGQPLFQIDTSDYELLVAQRDSELAQAKTALALERAESSAAVKEWKVLHGSKEIPELVSRAPQLRQAEAAVTSARAALENAKRDLVRTSFLFPFDGVVVESRVIEGQYLQAGQSYGTAYNAEKLQTRVTLDAEQLDWMISSEKAEAEIEVEYLGSMHRVPVILRQGDVFAESTTRFTPVYFDFKERESYLYPGQLAKVFLKGPVEQDVLKLPVSALQSDGKVWVYNTDNTVSSFVPEIIYRNKDHVAIRSRGGALTVVKSRLSGAIDGMTVERLNGEG